MPLGVFCETQRVPAVPQAFRGRVIQDLWALLQRGFGAGPQEEGSRVLSVAPHYIFSAFASSQYREACVVLVVRPPLLVFTRERAVRLLPRVVTFV